VGVQWASAGGGEGSTKVCEKKVKDLRKFLASNGAPKGDRPEKCKKGSRETPQKRHAVGSGVLLRD